MKDLIKYIIGMLIYLIGSGITYLIYKTNSAFTIAFIGGAITGVLLMAFYQLHDILHVK